MIVLASLITVVFAYITGAGFCTFPAAGDMSPWGGNMNWATFSSNQAPGAVAVVTPNVTTVAPGGTVGLTLSSTNTVIGWLVGISSGSFVYTTGILPPSCTPGSTLFSTHSSKGTTSSVALTFTAPSTAGTVTVTALLLTQVGSSTDGTDETFYLLSPITITVGASAPAGSMTTTVAAGSTTTTVAAGSTTAVKKNGVESYALSGVMLALALALLI